MQQKPLKVTISTFTDQIKILREIKLDPTHQLLLAFKVSKVAPFYDHPFFRPALYQAITRSGFVIKVAASSEFEMLEKPFEAKVCVKQVLDKKGFWTITEVYWDLIPQDLYYFSKQEDRIPYSFLKKHFPE